MKRAYVRPTMVGERFVANEYVAACGDIEHGNYKFECNAGKKYLGVLNYHYKVRQKAEKYYQESMVRVMQLMKHLRMVILLKDI